jgi:ferrochelatase
MKEIVLLVHHGTVEHMADMPGFLRNVRRGREAPSELVSEMQHRYELIGGSPLHAIAGRVAAKLEHLLGMPVRAAGRLWHPYPREVLEGMAVERVVVVPLAQHSAQVYADAARRDLAGIEVVAAENWGQNPALLDAFERRVRARADADAALVLTAHSLPMAVADGYEEEVAASAAALTARVRGLFSDVHVAFQSQGAGADAGKWLGPSLTSVLDGLVGKRRVVVAPIGFLADHVEILYDIDIEAKALAKARGLELSRTESLNDADDFVAVLEGIVRDLLHQRPS